MGTRKKFPIGIEDFVKLRENNYYFVDKTPFIREFLENPAEINLFTRPRRFGKSLMMNMVKAFFDNTVDPAVFDGLEITKDKKKCEEHLGKHPVILIALKDICADNYHNALIRMKTTIGSLAGQYYCLEESPNLTESEKAEFRQLVEVATSGDSIYAMSDETLLSGLYTLSKLLYTHYHRKVVLLIDEYDVPLDYANQKGYYKEMVSFIRNLFNVTLKGNPYLEFSILTGCLRVSKESIFTGMNNIRVNSLTSHDFTYAIGFTDPEIHELLDYYNLQHIYPAIKEWYDGYRFGGQEIYCPWDVLNYCYDQYTLKNPNPAYLAWFQKPKNYWINTSGNYIIHSLLKKATPQTLPEIELLIEGGILNKKIEENLTYTELEKTIDHIWSVLLSTGYLTCMGVTSDGYYQLKIPNMEIRSIFVDYIMEWFKENAHKEPSTLKVLCQAIKDQDAAQIQESLNEYLRRTISIRDTYVAKPKKENFYHGIMLGLLEHSEDWYIKSNVDAGDGYSDILIRSLGGQLGIILEIKYAEDGKFEQNCQKALDQIEKEHYEEELRDDGYTQILKYGIAFYKKRCMVALG